MNYEPEEDEVALAEQVSDAQAALDRVKQRNALLLPIMEQLGLKTAGEAIDFLNSERGSS